MVKNRIKVCARIKGGKQPKCKVAKVCSNWKAESVTVILLCNPSSLIFSNVFDINAKQEHIFGVIAQPIINSFLNGFNGTIFAYGQTGSGKTYTITGSPEDYNERGIIPRSIEQVFRFTSKSSEKSCIGISYMEIYNEVGYDLLDSKHQACNFEQLPKIVLLEDSKGEIHLRNLSIHNVSSVKEAMRLLFLGDTNRTIAETPSNEFSSRSHCIFIIYLSVWIGGTGKIRRSKLNLVDLAGSERIHKSNVTGVTLMEAKSINLSLYYLEQVILALSEAKRLHVPYRNSIMTTILKDSLGGNCFTLMLATVSISYCNFEETLSTCRFSERVAMISTDAYINEEFDPYQEINQLSKEVENLRNHLKSQTYFGDDANTALTDDEISKCKEIVDGFINSDETSCSAIEPNMKIIQQCFNLLKKEICYLKANLRAQKEKSSTSCEYENLIRAKDEEIERLNALLRNAITTETEEECDIESSHRSDECPPDICEEMETMPRRSKEEIRIFKIQGDLHKKYDIAKSIVPLIEQCQRNIIMIRKRIDSNQLPDDITQNLLKELQHQQNIYRESLLQLQSIKAQVEHLEHGLQQAEFMMGSKLKRWVCESTCEINGNDIPQIEGITSKRSASLGSTCKSVTVSTNDVKEIGLQTIEYANISYSTDGPSTCCDNLSDSSKQSSSTDCEKIYERSRSANCIRNEYRVQPINLEIDDYVDKPQSEICLGRMKDYVTSDCPTDNNKSIIMECREISPTSECTTTKKSLAIRSPPQESDVNNREPKRSRIIPPVILNSFTNTRKSRSTPPYSANKKANTESKDIPPHGSSKNGSSSIKQSQKIVTPESENRSNGKKSFTRSNKIPPIILGSFTNTRKSLNEPTDTLPPISDSFTNVNKSLRESSDRELFSRTGEAQPETLKSLTNSRKSTRESREIMYPGSSSVMNGIQSIRQSREISVPLAENSRRSLRESREIASPISDSYTTPRVSFAEARRASSLSPDAPSQSKKLFRESIEIPSSSTSLEGVRKSQSEEVNPIYYDKNDPHRIDTLYYENHSQEELTRGPFANNYTHKKSDTVIDLKKSSKSFQINNDISDREDTDNPYYSEQGIQNIDDYHVNSIPCLNILRGIASNSQSTFISNNVGSFLDGCHLLRPKVPYFDVHVKIDPNKQIKTTTVHQKIMSINPKSNDISGLLIPPSFFNKSSTTSKHPLQGERIPKLVKNLAGSLFHKLNKRKLKTISGDDALETEGATSGIEGKILEEDDVKSQKCSCEKLNKAVIKKSSVVKFADDLDNASPETSRDCPKETNELFNENITAETSSLFKDGDSKSFIEFIKTVPLTGDREVDEEIVNFYRTKFECK